MSKKKRGRERMVVCGACGRRVPRNKAITDNKKIVYTTDLKTDDDIKTVKYVTNTYCISCAKHRHILEKKKRQAARKREQSF